MDQRPNPNSYHANKKLDVKGANKINKRASRTEKFISPLLLPLLQLGECCLSLFWRWCMWMYGMSWKLIMLQENMYATTRSGWMKWQFMSALMLYWSHQRKLMMPMHPPIIILDAHHVHHISSVINCIQSMGIEEIYIPTGCPWVCRHIDMGTCKSTVSTSW